MNKAINPLDLLLLLAACASEEPSERSLSVLNAASGPFDAHLDQCMQCRDHPFQLCEAGAVLLKREARP